MADFETITIQGLPNLELALTTFLEGDNGNAVSGKFTVSQLAALIAPYVQSVGASSYLPTTGSVLPTTSAPSAFTFVGPGTYTQTTGGSIVTTAPLNLLSRNSTTWVLTLAMLTGIDLLGSANNLFDKTSPNITYNASLDGSGNVVPFAGGAVSHFVPLTPGVQYVLYGITDLAPRELKFINVNDGYIGSSLANSYPYLFTAPPTTAGMIFTVKVQGGGIDLPDVFVTKSSDVSLPIVNSKVGDFYYTKTKKRTIASDLTTDATIDGLDVLNSKRSLSLYGINVNLFNPKFYQDNVSVDGNGNIVAFTGAQVSEAIYVLQNTDYEISGVTDGAARAIIFYNTALVKIGSIIATGYPYRFTTPASTAYIKFTTKVQGATIPPKLKLSLPDEGVLKGISYPLEGCVVDVYGDSVSVDYPIYGQLLQKKTKAAIVNQRGMSGQSFQFRLQLDTNINPMLADNPDLVFIMSVNDHRSNAPIGSISDAPGAATSAGGLKKIIRSIVNSDKNTKIIIGTPFSYGDVKELNYPDSFSSAEPNGIGLFMSDYSNMFIQIAKNEGCEVLDLSTKCAFKPTIESFAAKRVYTRDGIHPNDAVGFPLLTTVIAHKINKTIL